jgi:hypothetical protein
MDLGFPLLKELKEAPDPKNLLIEREIYISIQQH